MVPAAPPYERRVIDEELDELLPALPAIALEGAKGVGKTRTAAQRAATIHRLDDPEQLAAARADPARLLSGPAPVLIDEWQQLPEVWDLIRRAVDDGAPPGSFLLTGSATPDPPPMHSGAGRIASLRMRPMTLYERSHPSSVSLAALLTNEAVEIDGQTTCALTDYAEEIIKTGLPGIRGLTDRALRTQLDSYLARIVEREIPEATGSALRNPSALLHWLRAYAAASSTTASFEAIRDASTAGQADKPARGTAERYRDALRAIWALDEVAGWLPRGRSLKELGTSAKHQLVDPGVAAQLLGLQRDTLLGAPGNPPSPMLGPLFESLATLSVRVFAQLAEARVGHLRTARGRHEVDLIVERPDGAIVGIEVKLTRTVQRDDCKQLHWLRTQLPDRVVDLVVLCTGGRAYRRADGVAVVPLALLGP